MIVDCISDLHGHTPELPGGDILIIAGDITSPSSNYSEFISWLKTQDYTHKIFIAGNHDKELLNKSPFSERNIHYLKDSDIIINGLNIYGSPWTPHFNNWYFTLSDKELAEKWSQIPKDTDILITHGPPYTILDIVPQTYGHRRTGCPHLLTAIGRVQPKLHVFGHIHESAGHYQYISTLCVNASIIDEYYQPIRNVHRTIYDGSSFKSHEWIRNSTRRLRSNVNNG